jgi:tetratricopeptide (TPR) repeat protein
MIRRLAILAVSVVLALGSAQDQQSAAVQYQKGVYAQNTTGDLDAAIQIYRQVIASNPSQRSIAAQAQYRLAQALLQKGDLNDAAREFQVLSSSYAEYKELIKSLAGAIPERTVYVGSPSPGGGVLRLIGRAPVSEIGTFENGRYHHNLTGIVFDAPAGWTLGTQGASSDDGEIVEFNDPTGKLTVAVWMKPDGTPVKGMEGALAADRDAKHLLRDDSWSIVHSAPRTVAGQQALSAMADFMQNGEKQVEFLTWVRSTSCRAQFFGAAPVADAATVERALDQMMASARIP